MLPDCRGSEKDIEESKELLENLKENLITRKLPKDCIITYKVPWTEKGIEPFTNCAILISERYRNQVPVGEQNGRVRDRTFEGNGKFACDSIQKQA